MPATLRPWLAACVLLFTLCGIASAAAANPVVLRDDHPSHEVWSAVTVLADPSRALSVQDALTLLPRFEAPPGTSGTLGIRTEPVWIRIPVVVPPSSDGLWVLDID